MIYSLLPGGSASAKSKPMSAGNVKNTISLNVILLKKHTLNFGNH